MHTYEYTEFYTLFLTASHIKLTANVISVLAWFSFVNMLGSVFFSVKVFLPFLCAFANVVNISRMLASVSGAAMSTSFDLAMKLNKCESVMVFKD